jgi:hypothetical protein
MWYEPSGGLQGLTLNDVASIVRHAKTSWLWGDKRRPKEE